MRARTAFAIALGALSIANASFGEERDPATGFFIADGFDTVRVQCTRCHSSKLVTQNHATREGWSEIIRWMQRTQKLGDLGADEPVILDYLAKYYGPGPPRSSVRRRPLPLDLRPAVADEDSERDARAESRDATRPMR